MPDRSPYDPDVDPDVARRLSAAFTALATSEVPAAVPGNAPRPVTRTRVGRRRRWGIAGGSLLVAAAAVVLALLLGSEVFDARVATTAPPASGGPAPVATTSAAPTPTAATTSPGADPSTSQVPPSSTAPDPAAPDPAAVTAAFAAVSHPVRSAVVAVPAGWEAADLDGAGVIRFWRSADGTVWTVAGTSTYPADAPGGSSGHSATPAAAALLFGMEHATFLVDGPFTGDSTGSVLAYTDSDAGWGVIKAGSDGLLHPTGDGFPALGDPDAANIGLSRDEALVDGLLQTTDCSATAPDNASCGLPGYSVVKYWRWDGTQFVLDHRTGPAS